MYEVRTVFLRYRWVLNSSAVVNPGICVRGCPVLLSSRKGLVLEDPRGYFQVLVLVIFPILQCCIISLYVYLWACWLTCDFVIKIAGICAQNKPPWSPAQVCQITCTAVWNQSHCPSDSLQAAAEEVQCSFGRLRMFYWWKSLYRWTTIQLAERQGLCGSWNQEVTHWSQPCAMHSAGWLWCPLPCQKWVWLDWYLSTLGWRCMASITAMSCCLSRCFQQSNVLQLTRLSFNKTALRHIAPATPSSCCSRRHWTSSVLTSGCQTAQVWTLSTTRSGESCSSVYINVV